MPSARSDESIDAPPKQRRDGGGPPRTPPGKRPPAGGPRRFGPVTGGPRPPWAGKKEFGKGKKTVKKKVAKHPPRKPEKE